MPLAYFKMMYDEAGRMTNEFIAPLPTVFTEGTQTSIYDSDNRLFTFNSTPVTHDFDGNMTVGPLNSSSAITHVYDVRNRLISVGASGSAPALSYGYDSEGNRTSITNGAQTTQFTIDPSSTLSRVLVRKTASTTNYYVYGPGLLYEADASDNTKTYHYDIRGSTVVLSNPLGYVTDRVEYNTYGTVTKRAGTTDTPFLYNGRYGVMTDANGLCYMRARYYNPYIRRFLNADPTGIAGGMNWYAYADDNPINSADPFGLATISLGVAGGGAVGFTLNGSLQGTISINSWNAGDWRIGYTGSITPLTGFSSGINGGFGVLVSFSMADRPEVFNGPSLTLGASAGLGEGAGFDVSNLGSNPSLDTANFNLFGGLKAVPVTPYGAPFQVHAMATITGGRRLSLGEIGNANADTAKIAAIEIRSFFGFGPKNPAPSPNIQTPSPGK